MVVPPVYVTIAVEGFLDEVVARKVVHTVGALPGRTYGQSGKAHLASRVNGYNQAAAFAPWFVVIDLDRDECAPRLRTALLPAQAQRMCFRVAVTEVESWLLADREEIARFLGVARNQVPQSPDALPDPKESLVAIARGSRSRATREDIVPRAASGRSVGPAYVSRMAEFVTKAWRPEVAATRSESLGGCLSSLRDLVDAERQAP